MDYYYIIKKINNLLNIVISSITEQLESQASDGNPDSDFAKTCPVLINEKFKPKETTTNIKENSTQEIISDNTDNLL